MFFQLWAHQSLTQPGWPPGLPWPYRVLQTSSEYGSSTRHSDGQRSVTSLHVASVREGNAYLHAAPWRGLPRPWVRLSEAAVAFPAGPAACLLGVFRTHSSKSAPAAVRVRGTPDSGPPAPGAAAGAPARGCRQDLQEQSPDGRGAARVFPASAHPVRSSSSCSLSQANRMYMVGLVLAEKMTRRYTIFTCQTEAVAQTLEDWGAGLYL